MRKRPARFEATCLALLGAVVGALSLGPACSNDSTDDSGTPGGSHPVAGDAGSTSSGASSSGATASGGGSSGAGDAPGASGAPAGGSDMGAMPTAGSGGSSDDDVPLGGQGGGTGGSAECASDDDCKVVNDCCSCEAIPQGRPGGECELLCVQGACEAQGISGAKAVCRSNRCVFDISCDRSLVTCKVAEPTCDPGMIASVEGNCYGPCIAAAECSAVTDCKDCAAGQACVRSQNFSSFTQCVEVSSACAASPTCECTDACQFSCSDTDGIACFCAAC